MCGLSDVTDQDFAGVRPLVARDNKCCEHYFQPGFWQARSLELRRRERRMPAARCLGQDLLGQRIWFIAAVALWTLLQHLLGDRGSECRHASEFRNRAFRNRARRIAFTC
jgi:hypothetical protein